MVLFALATMMDLIARQNMIDLHIVEKNDAVDERSVWDKRDLLDTVSVIMQVLSTDENIITNAGYSEDQMDNQEFAE